MTTPDLVFFQAHQRHIVGYDTKMRQGTCVSCRTKGLMSTTVAYLIPPPKVKKYNAAKDKEAFVKKHGVTHPMHPLCVVCAYVAGKNVEKLEAKYKKFIKER